MSNLDERTAWEDADLELFHDGEMAEERASVLAGDLRRDARLRERLGEIRRLDLVVAAVCGEVRVNAVGRVAAWRGLRIWFAAAAVVLMGVASWLWIGRGATPRAGQGTVVAESLEVEAAPRYAAVREIARIRLGANAAPIEMPALAQENAADAETIDTFSLALERGDVLGASHLLADAPAERRGAYATRLGEALRSATTANQVLDRLNASGQLEMCEAWVHEPHLRPVVFARLAELKVDGALADRVAVLSESLAGDPGLRPWVRSYGLR